MSIKNAAVKHFALLILLGLVCGVCVWQFKLYQSVAAVQSAATQARLQCFGKIHHDTYDFERCINVQLANNTQSPNRQLGIAYFGWVGAMNSVRMGMLGAAQTAQNMLVQATKLQKTVGLNNEQLCKVVDGDCEVRIAQYSNP